MSSLEWLKKRYRHKYSILQDLVSRLRCLYWSGLGYVVCCLVDEEEFHASFFFFSLSLFVRLPCFLYECLLMNLWTLISVSLQDIYKH